VVMIFGLFVGPLALALAAPLVLVFVVVGLLPLLRRPAVRLVRSLWAGQPRPGGLGPGNTAALAAMDLAILCVLAVWGATTVLGSMSPIGVLSLAEVVFGLLPLALLRGCWLDVAILTEAPAPTVARRTVKLLFDHRLELFRVAVRQWAWVGIFAGLVLGAFVAANIGFELLGASERVRLGGSGIVGFVVGIAAWLGVSRAWVSLALYRVATTHHLLDVRSTATSVPNDA
jgi:hypothetical protein